MAYVEDERNNVVEEMLERFRASENSGDESEMAWLSRLTATFEPQLKKSENYVVKEGLHFLWMHPRRQENFPLI